MGFRMLTLSTKDNRSLGAAALSGSLILRVTTNPFYPQALRDKCALLLPDSQLKISPGFAATLIRSTHPEAGRKECGAILISDSLGHVTDGDVIKISPDLRISCMYRRNAKSNAILVTERCNSFCLMCSQPPRDIDDSYRFAEWMRAIPLFDRDTPEVCITGGEPTLLGADLFHLVRALQCQLPETSLHILSNGRNFQDLALASQLASVGHHDLMLGVPLYADVASIHDYVVQADGAFDETIKGILNLKRCGVRVEIRVVIHKATYKRLPALARFIVRNLQFVDQVALMGLEITGFTKANLDELWIDPIDYKSELAEAATILRRGSVRAVIYNHQLCLIDRKLWPISAKSISEWKNEYMPECSGCAAISECGGFFSSAHIKRSPNISPIRQPQLDEVTSN